MVKAIRHRRSNKNENYIKREGKEINIKAVEIERC
jgi:hypothetical protein